ncbi:MAG: DUF4870 domain-containing protein [Planctomycetales bacterium]|nr:DUF4870 domain-containing protein [Planctomycetales bacterium]
MDSRTNTWAMILHLSLLAGYAIPLAGLLAPILIWQLKKEEMPELDAHGKMAANFIITMIVYSLIAGVLVFLVIGIFLLLALAAVGVIFPIIAAIKANDGVLWKYPLVVQWLK